MMNILIQHIVEMHQSGYCENNVLIGPGGIIQKLKFTQACDLIVGHGYWSVDILANIWLRCISLSV